MTELAQDSPAASSMTRPEIQFFKVVVLITVILVATVLAYWFQQLVYALSTLGSTSTFDVVFAGTLPLILIVVLCLASCCWAVGKLMGRRYAWVGVVPPIAGVMFTLGLGVTGRDASLYWGSSVWAFAVISCAFTAGIALRPLLARAFGILGVVALTSMALFSPIPPSPEERATAEASAAASELENAKHDSYLGKAHFPWTTTAPGWTAHSARVSYTEHTTWVISPDGAIASIRTIEQESLSDDVLIGATPCALVRTTAERPIAERNETPTWCLIEDREWSRTDGLGSVFLDGSSIIVLRSVEVPSDDVPIATRPATAAELTDIREGLREFTRDEVAPVVEAWSSGIDVVDVVLP